MYKNTTSTPKLQPSFEALMYDIKRIKRLRHLDEISGFMDDLGFDEHPEAASARLDNALTDALILKRL